MNIQKLFMSFLSPLEAESFKVNITLLLICCREKSAPKVK